MSLVRELPQLELIGVRLFGGDNIPMVIGTKRECGLASDCIRNGCIGIEVRHGGGYSLLHLTADDASRLSNVLHSLAG